MKTIAVGMNLRAGPYGGGNQFGHTLVHALEYGGWRVVFDLTSPDIDLILVTELRQWLDICAFDLRAALRYQANHPAPIVLRVNECNERKNKTLPLLNQLLRAGAKYSDHTVYISSWLQKIIWGSQASGLTSSVIRNGADEAIFNPSGYQHWDQSSPLKIVTHHWSANRLKGWDIYEQLDALIGKSNGELAFTYIGNAPTHHQLTHTIIKPPLAGYELAAALKQHHIYVTASINEPAGMHHIEAALCGLPLLYRLSGALPEYCQDFGVPFSGQADFPEALEAMRKSYGKYQQHMKTYSHCATRMTQEYINLFRALTDHSPSTRHTTRWPGQLNLAAKLAALKLRDSIFR